MMLGPKESEGILANMQKLADQINNPYRQFKEDLKDMQAWTQYGPAKTQALQARAEARGTDRATLYNIAQQQAALQASQNMAQTQAASLRQSMGASGASGAGTPGGVGNTGAPVGSGMPSYVTNEINRLLGLGYVGQADALRNKFLNTEMGNESKAGFDPANSTPTLRFIPELDRELDLTPPEFKQYQTTGTLPGRFGVTLPGKSAVPTAPAPRAPGASPAVVPSASPAAAPMSSAPTQAGTPGVAAQFAAANNIPGVISADRDFAKQSALFADSQKPGYTGFPVARPGTSQHEIGRALDIDSSKLTSADRQKLLDAGFKQPSPTRSPNHWELSKDVAAPVINKAISETVKSNATPDLAMQRASVMVSQPDRPLNSAESKIKRDLKQKEAENDLNIAAKQNETIVTEAAKRQNKMQELANATEKTLKAADTVINIASDPANKDIQGIGKGLGPRSIAATAVSMFPKMDQHTAEDFIANKTLSPEQINNRDLLNAAAKQLGIEFAADVFKGARMGIGLERMAMDAKGIGAEFLPETNIINATVIRESALFNRAKSQLWKEYKEQQGKYADFDTFERTPKYLALEKNTHDRLSEQFPKYFKSTDERPKTTEAPAKGAGLTEGQTGKSASGKDIVVKNGKWVYVK
jgi:hypothetical protein